MYNFNVTEETQQGYSWIADDALFSGDEVLLVKYASSKDYDGQTGWFFPDSSIKYLEHPEKAAKRILKDQLGLNRFSNVAIGVDRMVLVSCAPA